MLNVRRQMSGVKYRGGFTIIELLMATMILAILVLTAGGIYLNFYQSFQSVKASHLVYGEARFVMERLVKEVRKGTIDYEEYYNQAHFFKGGAMTANQTYGQNYCRYSQEFYDFGPDGQPDTFDDIPTGKRKSLVAPLSSSVQNKLFLIQNDGTRRTYVRRVNDGGVGKVALLHLAGKDWGLDKIDSTRSDQLMGCEKDIGEGDGLIDTWICEKGFNCKVSQPVLSGCRAEFYEIIDHPQDLSKSSFLDITPGTLDIADLQFFIAPADDPRKAYLDSSVQIQPHVTIKLTVRANPAIAHQFKGNPEIVLESTVSARTQTEVLTACNRRECNELPTPSVQACPKQGDVAGGAVTSCRQGIYPPCTDQLYEAKALENMKAFYAKNPHPDVRNGLDYTSPFNGKSFYEPDSETGSCTGVNADACKQRRCTDGHDNDGNGFTDQQDSACSFHLCHNGIRDFVIKNGQKTFLEDCIDVGGICGFRPKETSEKSCYDGYDNDCNGSADELDSACIDLFCNNGIKDPTAGNGFINPNGLIPQPNNQPPLFTRHYLVDAKPDLHSSFNEAAVDIGGLCEQAAGDHKKKTKENTAALCSDGLDNDADGVADELDIDCEPVICENGKRDTDLVSRSYTPADYLGGYEDNLNLQNTDLDETVTDIGGLCSYKQSKAESATATGCFDRQDNDADGLTDQSDPDCCVDLDKDQFFPLIFQGANFTCAPKDATAAGPPGQIDCNDADQSIYPGQKEICDDAAYPQDARHIFKRNGYEIDLRGKPVDNNCSGANGLTIGDSGWDHDDPVCCVDSDGDGFGEKHHYIYQKNGRCTGLVQAPAGVQLTQRTPYDCNDQVKGINPGVIENTISLCSDGLNNNCSINAGGSSRADHIDLYAKTIGIKKAFDDELFEPECCGLTGFSWAPQLEICDDDPQQNPLINGVSSDENCNGLQGDGDHQCLTKDGLIFKDHFTSSLNQGKSIYIDWTGTTAHFDSSGQFTIKNGVSSGIVASVDLPVSPSCQSIKSVTLHPVFANGGGGVDYEVSNLGFRSGSSETYLQLGQPHVFQSQGNRLRWRITLRPAGGIMPVLEKMEVKYNCK